MQAGKLRHRVSLQVPVKTQSPLTGATVTSWQEVQELWADVVALSAREFIASQATQAEVTTRITIRFRSDITSKHRIVYGSKIFNIEGILPDPTSGRDYLTLPCSEGVNDG